MRAKRYHLGLIALHWVLAILVLIELTLGSTFLTHTANDVPEKLMALRNHMIAGILILILTVIRLLVRLKTTHPAPAYGEHALLNRFTELGHYTLYLLPLVMSISGLVIAAQSDLPRIVFEGLGHLPASFEGLAARAVHGIAGTLLILLVAGHVLAALYHHFIRKDGLLNRMWPSRK